MNGAASERLRLLAMARLCGAAALNVIGQVVVDMPDGYFGGVDQVTRAGALFSMALLLLTALAVIALGRSWRSGLWLGAALPCASVAAFVPALTQDPVVAGILVLWNLLLLAQIVVPTTEPARRLFLTPSEERLATLLPATRHLALVALLLNLSVVGYRLSDRPLTQWVCVMLGFLSVGSALPVLRNLHASGHRLALLPLLPAAAALPALSSPTVALSLLAVAQAVILIQLLGRQDGAIQILRSFYDRPSRLLVSSFAAIIAVGTLLLSLPAAAAGPHPIAPLDALFTATSATCVTGLIVLDTPHAFSGFGQAAILVLIQIGGLGIMVLSTFATLLLGGSLGLKGEGALTRVLDVHAGPSAYRLTRFIVLVTLAVEAVGAVALAACYAAAGLSPMAALWRGVFHSISAFCNAGFALQSDSLVMFRNSPSALLIFAALIVAGGLGFVVLAGLASRYVSTARLGLSTQVRTVLVVSGVLVFGGTLLYAAAEWDRSLTGLSFGHKLLNALFQSVTLRTAGFNSVGLEHLAPATVVVMLLLMFIGASPGSTGGGIKTTTFGVLLAAVRSAVHTDRPVMLFGREVPREIVLRSLAITVISGGLCALGLFLLLWVEPLAFDHLLFETISAFGTVGLSLGATAKLGPAGKLVIIALMFVGRTGPLTLALLLGTSRRSSPVCRYPETRLMVG